MLAHMTDQPVVYDPDERVQMNVRVPQWLRDEADVRRKALGLSRDKWVTRALSWALSQPPGGAVTTAPGRRTVRQMRAPGNPRPFTRKMINRVEFYRDDAGGWRWRFVAGENGQIIGDSGQGYADLRDCRNSIHRILLANTTAPVEFDTHTL